MLSEGAPGRNSRKNGDVRQGCAHRNVIKFCFDLGMTPVETQKKLQLTEDHRHVSWSLVYKWHKRFEDGSTDSLHGKPGRPWEINASTVNNVNDVIRSDRRQTVREVGEKLGLSKTSVHQELNKDLSMNKVCARWIPRLLTENEKERRVVESREFLLKINETRLSLIGSSRMTKPGSTIMIRKISASHVFGRPLSRLLPRKLKSRNLWGRICSSCF